MSLITPIVNFLFELGQLKRIRHEGWRIAGVENPETVAAHSLRAAQIAFFLAHLEQYEDPNEVVTMVVFHDIGETRIGDLHQIARHYTETKELEAVRDQTEPLEALGDKILESWKQSEDRNTVVGRIARDADLLEQAITAKEYAEKGYPEVEHWINNVEKALKCDSAKVLLKEIRQTHSSRWWKTIKQGIPSEYDTSS